MSRTNEDTASFGIPAKELLLDAGAFPAGWTFNPCGDNCERIEGAAHAERSYFLPNVPGLVLLEVSRFADIEASRRKYRTYFETDFQERVPPNVRFAPPLEATFQSDFADEYHFGCGIDEVPGCRAIFRYGNYFVYLYASWDNGNGEGLQLSEIQQLLQALDERVITNVASCYSKIFVTKQQNKLPNLNEMQRNASNLKVRFIKRDTHILIVSKRLKILKATSNNG